MVVEVFDLGRALEEASGQQTFNPTDLGNSERFAAQHRKNVRFCTAWGKWLIWDGRRWKPDETEAVKRKARKTVRKIYAEAGRIVDPGERKRLAKWAVSSEANQKIKACLELGQSEGGIPVTPSELDADIFALNVQNGCLDLRTGALRPHNRADLITKLAPVRYEPEAQAPTWDAFLERTMDGNQELISFLRCAVGYSLTGDTSEQCLLFLYGTGANGKSTLLEIIRTMLGDYAKQTDFSTFLQQKFDTIRNDLARLKGSRLVSAVEAGAGKRLAEVIVKQLTGQDTVTARFLFKEYFEFVPQFKIWLAANHKPAIWGTDHAIWRRIRLIPFAVTIPEEEQDPTLVARLKTELPGILRWAVQGCLEWQEKGLPMPDAVRQATEGYREEMDVLGPFISDRCLIDSRVKTRAKDLYDAYLQYCLNNGDEPIKKRTFGVRLGERSGLKGDKFMGERYWLGIDLLSQNADFIEGQDARTQPGLKSSNFPLRNSPRDNYTEISPDTSNASTEGPPKHLIGRCDPALLRKIYGSTGL